ncbi:MAG: NAD(P)/FAD-dependent oxidoreductase [Chitinophagaceae bacterium]
MSNNIALYDCIVVGGGLAGLSQSILLAQNGWKVLVLEKESYPFHKVCGEYLSMESLPFLERLGLKISPLKLPRIDHIQISDPDGRSWSQPFAPGGMGISRYLLDQELALLARKAGVEIREKTRVTDISFQQNHFIISAQDKQWKTLGCAGSWGKRSNLDIKKERDFTRKSPDKRHHYLGIKYHIHGTFPTNRIALHHFKNGYCGLAPIEDGKHCLCYLSTADNLKTAGNDLKKMEQQILFRNPFLRELFSDAEFLYPQPLVISQISFSKKSPVEDHILMTGDAAGMIAPICGNGMSMALQAGKISAGCQHAFLSGEINRAVMELRYRTEWKRAFNSRLSRGRLIQGISGHPIVTRVFVAGFRKFPSLLPRLIRASHGQTF